MRDRLLSLLPGTLMAVVTWLIFWTLLVTEAE